MSKLENLIRLSSQTFLHRREAQNAAKITGGSSESFSVFQNLFSELVSLTNSIKGEDVGVPKLLQYAHQLRRRGATALYSGIYDNAILSVCVFVLYPNSTIPLHSHPGMYGILKVLHGGVLVRSFTGLQKVDYSKPSVPKFQAVECVTSLNEFSEPAIVTPENNLHEVCNPESETAVFMDILSPRYESNNCYFSATQCKPGVYELVQEACPSSFYTITVPFPLMSSLSHLHSRPN